MVLLDITSLTLSLFIPFSLTQLSIPGTYHTNEPEKDGWWFLTQKLWIDLSNTHHIQTKNNLGRNNSPPNKSSLSVICYHTSGVHTMIYTMGELTSVSVSRLFAMGPQGNGTPDRGFVVMQEEERISLTASSVLPYLHLHHSFLSCNHTFNSTVCLYHTMRVIFLHAIH